MLRSAPPRPSTTRSTLAAFTLAALGLLFAPATARAGDGFGHKNEVGVMAIGLATSGTVPLKLALFATEGARKIDVPGYFRVDAQPQRIFT